MNKEWVKFLPSDLTNTPESSVSTLVDATMVGLQIQDDLEMELEQLMDTMHPDSVDSATEAHDTCHVGTAYMGESCVM